MTRGTPIAAFFLALRAAQLCSLSSAISLQYTIPQRGEECLFERLKADESVTLSVFITSGAELKGTAVFEGPVAPHDIDDTALALKEHLGYYHQGRRYGTGAAGNKNNLQEEILIDFESDIDWDDDFADDDEYDDYVDDDDHVDDDETPQKNKDTKEYREKQTARIARAEERKQRWEAKRAAKIRKHMRATEGDAVSKTWKVKAGGWYKACIRGSWYQITAEMELRKESDLGGIDPRTGHVNTYERQLLIEEEKELDEATAGLQDSDLKTTHDHLRRLTRLLREIKEQQQSERHRLSVHAATNEHSHSRMVLNSLLETVMFMLITGFQIFTIRKWFSGSPMLGR